MNSAIVRQLVFKDLYLLRWMILGAIVAGIASASMLPTGPVAAYVAGVSLICVLVILNIFLVMNGVAQERRDKTMLFVLSLPVSTLQYTVAKVIANMIAFLVPWLILTMVTFLIITRSAVPDGILPFWIAVLAYLLCYYCVLLAVGLLSDAAGWHAAAITVGNISVNFFIPIMLTRPSVAAYGSGPVAIWSSDVVVVIVGELIAGAAVLALAVYAQARRSNFV